MPSVISGDANVSATEFGFLDGVTSSLQTQIDAKLPLAGGKILQIVRATDSTDRSTTSISLVDVTGMSVTITPQKSDSAVMVVMTGYASPGTSATFFDLRITDSSNNVLSGASPSLYLANLFVPVVVIGYSTPATTSATTYKLRFRSSGGTAVTLYNSQSIGQMYAIEVSA